VTLLRPGRLATAATLSLFLLFIAGTAHAATQILVGVKKVRFAWAPASGQPTGYLVSWSLNLGAYQTYATTVEPEIEIPVKPGDQVSIRVAATGYDSAGVYRVGPESTTSDRVSVVASPTFPVTGFWTLRCESCSTVSNRSLADASLVVAQAPGVAAARIMGIAKLQNGRDQIVWHNPTSGTINIYDAQFLAPIPSLSNTGALTLRSVGSTDLDRDGNEELVMQRTDTGAVSVWGVSGGRFSNIGSIPTRSGSKLVAVDDFDNNGQVDLLWRDTTARTLDLWKMRVDPTSGLPVSQMLLQSVRVASNLAGDATVASTGDYDGDGSTDVLWRYADGRIVITYLSAGAPVREVTLLAAAGDIDRHVVESLDIIGTAGEEIAMQDDLTGLIWILDPSVTGAVTRTKVVHPGSEWKVAGFGR
jgi:hypothetical protein